jgi:hypothetical protein
LGAIVEFNFMVCGARHPRSIRGRDLSVIGKIAPDCRLRQRIQVSIREITVQQMKQGLETLDGHHRKAGLGIRERPDRVRSREIAETCPAKRLQISWSGLKARTEWSIAVPIVFGGDFIRIGSARFQPLNPRVIGVNNLVIEPIGVDSLLRGYGSSLFPGTFYFDSGINRTSRGRPGNGDFGSWIASPCNVNLLRRTSSDLESAALLAKANPEVAEATPEALASLRKSRRDTAAV